MKWPRRFEITGSDNTVYMIRWTLLTLPFLSIKLHKFVRSDADCMHDHPWSFVSIMLWGRYYEETPDGARTVSAGNIIFRRAKHTHRIFIIKPCWTIVFTFKRVREWGFHTSEGWVKWSEYFKRGLRRNGCE